MLFIEQLKQKFNGCRSTLLQTTYNTTLLHMAHIMVMTLQIVTFGRDGQEGSFWNQKLRDFVLENNLV